jgi:DNA repair protein RadC
VKIASSREAYTYLNKLLTSDVEEFWVVGLRADRSVIQSVCLFRGTVDTCPVHPRDIFRFACVTNSSAILVAHNHPSESAAPSNADRKVTRELMAASRILQIPLLDHIIVTRKEYWSFADKKVARAETQFSG